MVNYKNLAKSILDEVGGPENISNMTHCATRLRLTLKDDKKANIKQLDGVANVVNKAGQYQILIGTEVPKLYDEFEELVNNNGQAQVETSNVKSGGIITNIFFSYFSHFCTIVTSPGWFWDLTRFNYFSSSNRCA